MRLPFVSFLERTRHPDAGRVHGPFVRRMRRTHLMPQAGPRESDRCAGGGRRRMTLRDSVPALRSGLFSSKAASRCRAEAGLLTSGVAHISTHRHSGGSVPVSHRLPYSPLPPSISAARAGHLGPFHIRLSTEAMIRLRRRLVESFRHHLCDRRQRAAFSFRNSPTGHCGHAWHSALDPRAVRYRNASTYRAEALDAIRRMRTNMPITGSKNSHHAETGIRTHPAMVRASRLHGRNAGKAMSRYSR